MFIAGMSMSIENAFSFMLFQLFSGGILFGIVYMITDPVTAPLSTPGRLLYSLLFVSFVVVIRLFGAYPEGVAFAILFANMFSSLIDYPGILPKKRLSYGLMYASILITMSLIVFFGFGGY
jgi:electron transport complex protein RnfD